jgi:hypothetical protein
MGLHVSKAPQKEKVAFFILFILLLCLCNVYGFYPINIAQVLTLTLATKHKRQVDCCHPFIVFQPSMHAQIRVVKLPHFLLVLQILEVL